MGVLAPFLVGLTFEHRRKSTRRTSAMDASFLQRNHLLSLLKPEVQQRLLPLLKPVTISIGQIVSKANRPVSTVYFPLSFVSSSLRTTEDGITREIATVGNEGFVGLPLLLGTQYDPLDAIAQIGGEGLSMAAKDFISAIDDGGTGLRNILQLYTQANIVQVIQNAACNRSHNIERRCARWIIMTQDRCQEDSFILGHHFVTYMLNASQDVVMKTMTALTKANLITYSGGRISVLDRPRLKEASCSCYDVVNREYHRLLGTRKNL
jgi:Crp-like helix-turn-helix protein